MSSGWVILDKPSGLFSRTAGGRVARMCGEKVFGHIGTLDPMASGVLAIAIGGATKMIPFVEDVSPDIKEYLFSLQFGFETDTLDITGHETRRTDIIPTRNMVESVLSNFIGNIAQIPPAYSAVHVAGRRAYEMARRGNIPEIKPRNVRIDALELVNVDKNSWMFHVVCGRGTYVRAIARDIANACGTIATVDMIRRTKSGAFDIKNAVKLDFLENVVNNNGACQDFLMCVDTGLGDIPVLCLDDKSALLYRNGGFIQTDVTCGLYRVYSGDRFIGIGHVCDGVLRPKRTI